MSRPLFYLISMAIVLVAGCQSHPQSSTLPETFDPLLHDWPHDVSDISPDPDVVYGRLDNGLRYMLQTNSRPLDEAVLRMKVLAGSRHETPETMGIAHYLEHMAFNGSENVPEGEMVKSLERLGLSFGADTNASTTFSRTEYRLNLPRMDDETVDYALFLMRETASRLTISPDAVERERGVVMAEEARSNTPARAASRAFMQYFFPNILQTQNLVIGTPETLEAIDAPALRAFYETYYRPERTMLVMAGDFDVSVMEEKIKTVFADWNNSAPKVDEPDLGRFTNPDTRAVVYSDPELTLQLTLMDTLDSSSGFDTTERRLTAFKRSVANGIINQRIQKKLLSPDAPVLSAGISYAVGRLGDQRIASGTAKDEDWQAVLAMLDTEIRTGLEYGFDQTEYEEILANSRRSLTDALAYSAKRPSGSLAGGIMGAFNDGRVRTTPQQNLDSFESHVALVSLLDIEDTFKQMWQDFDPHIWMQGANIDDLSADDILDAFEQARSRDVDPPETREALDFAYQEFGEAGEIQVLAQVMDFDIEQIEFENNVRLNLKKTDFEDNWVRLQVTVGEGWNAMPIDRPEITALASYFSMGGFEAHPVSDLSQVFAGKQVSMNFNVGTERLVMSAATNPDDIRDQLNIWTAMITAPGYREEWKQRFIDGIEASFHTIDSTPGGVAARDLARLWANGDTRFGLLPLERYRSVEISDVKSVLAPILTQGAIEIGIVGDFDRDKVVDAVANTFGALPTRNGTFQEKPEAFDITFPNPERVVLTHTGADNQGAIHMGWPISQAWALDKDRAYSLIKRVLQNRMTDIIREDLGLTYSPSVGGVYNRLNDDYGYVSVSMTSDPQYFAAFETAVTDIISGLRSGDISQDDLDRARTPILEGFERGERENSAWVSLVTRSQSQPVRMDWRRTRTQAYEAFTPEILNSYAKELFAETEAHIVEIRPESAQAAP